MKTPYDIDEAMKQLGITYAVFIVDGQTWRYASNEAGFEIMTNGSKITTFKR